MQISSIMSQNPVGAQKPTTPNCKRQNSSSVNFGSTPLYKMVDSFIARIQPEKCSEVVQGLIKKSIAFREKAQSGNFIKKAFYNAKANNAETDAYCTYKREIGHPTKVSSFKTMAS